MHTRRIDAVLEALANCRAHLPPLRDLYRPESPERAALQELLETVDRTHAAVFGPKVPPA